MKYPGQRNFTIPIKSSIKFSAIDFNKLPQKLNCFLSSDLNCNIVPTHNLIWRVQRVWLTMINEKHSRCSRNSPQHTDKHTISFMKRLKRFINWRQRRSLLKAAHSINSERYRQLIRCLSKWRKLLAYQTQTHVRAPATTSARIEWGIKLRHFLFLPSVTYGRDHLFYESVQFFLNFHL